MIRHDIRYRWRRRTNGFPTGHRSRKIALPRVVLPPILAQEVEGWRTRAEQLRLPSVTDEGVIEQFDGYFELETLPVEHDDNDMPMYQPGYHHYNLAGTKLLKQADVVMPMYVLPDEYSDEVNLANYEYYEPLTLHKSS
jgi:trehalose/maltose hydrolase-like predicted phosphorylase